MSHDPAYTDLTYDEQLALRNRRDDHAPAETFAQSFPVWAGRVSAGADRSSDRERRAYSQERAARAALAPRTGNVEVHRTSPAQNSDGTALERRAA